MITDKTNQDNPGVKLPPPVIYFLLGLAGVGLDKFIPLSLGAPEWLQNAGIAVFLAGICLIIYVAKIFKSEGTEIEPWKTTTKIVTYGPYAISRNPIYVAACGVPIGLGLYFNTLWAFFAFIPCLFLVYITAVKKEEKYLQKKFGQEYSDYKAKVRRWL